MENKDIDIMSGSKLIAEYLGWQYIPSNDLQGFPKPGWFEVNDNQRMLLARYEGWTKVGDKAVRFVCRKHSDLRFFNSLDALIPVIQKIEKENREVKFHLNNNGCEVKIGKCWEYSSFTLPNWSQNVFTVVVNLLKENKVLCTL